MTQMRSVEESASPHILSAVEPLTVVGAYSGTVGAGIGGNRSPDMENDLSVTLDERELWLRFQNLTNEMIVTKNGR